ncbi:MAG: hypothetical protein Q4G25_02325 [Paracoccus sp. (in: a-proteobacteria)]|nr:hypothetical protein [Paracoccus sp. (in: a-proteobacteria)]
MASMFAGAQRINCPARMNGVGGQPSAAGMRRAGVRGSRNARNAAGNARIGGFPAVAKPVAAKLNRSVPVNAAAPERVLLRQGFQVDLSGIRAVHFVIYRCATRGMVFSLPLAGAEGWGAEKRNIFPDTFRERNLFHRPAADCSRAR